MGRLRWIHFCLVNVKLLLAASRLDSRPCFFLISHIFGIFVAKFSPPSILGSWGLMTQRAYFSKSLFWESYYCRLLRSDFLFIFPGCNVSRVLCAHILMVSKSNIPKVLCFQVPTFPDLYMPCLLFVPLRKTLRIPESDVA